MRHLVLDTGRSVGRSSVTTAPLTAPVTIPTISPVSISSSISCTVANFSSGGSSSSSTTSVVPNQQQIVDSSRRRYSYAYGATQLYGYGQRTFSSATADSGGDANSTPLTRPNDPGGWKNFEYDPREDPEFDQSHFDYEDVRSNQTKADRIRKHREKYRPKFSFRHRDIRSIEKDIARIQRPGSLGETLNTWEDAVMEKPDAPPPVRRITNEPPGQIIYPATQEDIDILMDADYRYIHPRICEGSTVIRLVRLSDPVTSPVGRVLRNSQFGIRGTEKYHLLGFGIMSTCIVFSLGFWQLERMNYKKNLLDLRAKRLAAPRILIERSPFPWGPTFQKGKDQIQFAGNFKKNLRDSLQQVVVDSTSSTSREDETSTILLGESTTSSTKLVESTTRSAAATAANAALLSRSGDGATENATKPSHPKTPDEDLGILIELEETGRKLSKENTEAYRAATDALKAIEDESLMKKVNTLSHLAAHVGGSQEIGEYQYRVVEARGVFDLSKEMRVGPRSMSDELGNAVVGFLHVCPLILEDGNTILVNRGFMGVQKMKQRLEHYEMPAWVRVRGVLESAEIPSTEMKHGMYIKNRPYDGKFQWLVAEDLAESCGARNFDEAKLALITAYDVFYEESEQSCRLFQMRPKKDFLCFWSDEHTNFNYALQWFGMGMVFMGMTLYKFVEVSRWRW